MCETKVEFGVVKLCVIWSSLALCIFTHPTHLTTTNLYKVLRTFGTFEIVTVLNFYFNQIQTIQWELRKIKKYLYFEIV